MPVGQALSSATMSQSDENKEKKKKGKKGARAKGATDVASTALGALGGPAGTLLSTGISAAAGLVEGNRAEKAAEAASPRPKRRRLAKGLEVYGEGKRKREAALATLSQAVFDWAASIR